VGVRGVAFTFGMGMTVGGVLVCSLSVGVQPVFRRLPFSERRLVRALVFVATLDSVVLAVRIVSMFTDSSIRETWTGEPKCFYCYCPPLVWSLSLEESGEPPDRRSRKFRLCGTRIKRPSDGADQFLSRRFIARWSVERGLGFRSIRTAWLPGLAA
jgi:hypothetical protein